jgi:hypothetical protein
MGFRLFFLIGLLAGLLVLTGNPIIIYAQQEELIEEEAVKVEKKKEEPKEQQKEQPKQTESNELEQFEKQSEEVMTDAPPAEAERMKYYKEKYEDTYNNTFEEVWGAILKCVENENCQVAKKTYSQTDQGLYKGSIVSDYCIFAMGNDTTVDNLKKYSKEVPIIRGGVWITGRFQYKFTVNEREDGTVNLVLKGEMSGFEEYVTYSIHFWESNGYKEYMMLKRIKEYLASAPK